MLCSYHLLKLAASFWVPHWFFSAILPLCSWVTAPAAFIASHSHLFWQSSLLLPLWLSAPSPGWDLLWWAVQLSAWPTPPTCPKFMPCWAIGSFPYPTGTPAEPALSSALLLPPATNLSCCESILRLMSVWAEWGGLASGSRTGLVALQRSFSYSLQLFLNN